MSISLDSGGNRAYIKINEARDKTVNRALMRIVLKSVLTLPGGSNPDQDGYGASSPISPRPALPVTVWF